MTPPRQRPREPGSDGQSDRVNSLGSELHRTHAPPDDYQNLDLKRSPPVGAPRIHSTGTKMRSQIMLLLAVVVALGILIFLALPPLLTAPYQASGPKQSGDLNRLLPESPTPPALGVPQEARALYHWPLRSSGKVTSCFGPRTLKGVTHFHKGIDIAATYGDPVYPSLEGEVEHFTLRNDDQGYGTYVILRHLDGSSTLYAHLQPDLSVKLSQTLTREDMLGRIGNTGFTTGPHLHFEVRSPTNRSIDPAGLNLNRLGTRLFDRADAECWNQEGDIFGEGLK